MLVRYAVAQKRRHDETMGYRYYLTELIRMQAQGMTFSKSLHELTHPQPEVDPLDIVADVIARGGLEVVDGRT